MNEEKASGAEHGVSAAQHSSGVSGEGTVVRYRGGSGGPAGATHADFHRGR